MTAQKGQKSLTLKISHLGELSDFAWLFVKRETPLVVTLDAIWKPKDHWVFLGGPGFEFAPSESYALFRLGVEYEFEFAENIDLSPSILYDIERMPSIPLVMAWESALSFDS